MTATVVAAPPGARGVEPKRALALGRDVLATEAAALRSVAERLDAAFIAAVRMLFDCRGRVVVIGIGKSGHVGRKLAATLASTGTPAFFVHAAEASHGDLGMIASDDVALLLSNSGETDELVSLVPHLKRQGARLIALTGNERSSLASAADVHLDASVDAEACPLGLAPTASTTAAVALGDALALALLDARGFSVEDFARSHPGGSLGRRLLTHVADVMRTGDGVPAVALAATLADAVMEMSGKGMGMTAVVGDARRVEGIFTDGDLRRCFGRVRDFTSEPIAGLMTRNPRSIGPDRLAIDCVELMETAPKVMALLVVDGANRLLGAVHLHDLFRARVV
ncbi:MAG TPA: KpsF/GutQ family sugar-phosphate isomerase [Casimicrobiaceae bacterium]|jgi:arabinose-5-phosphate isomerase|nr:KpsF/GutQ family sugar-phosphate isomerase [Casimicrobiaceae bacterium]